MTDSVPSFVPPPTSDAAPAAPHPSGTADVADLAGGTGDPRVDLAIARLGELAALPTHGHVAVFEDVHRRLQEILGELGGS